MVLSILYSLCIILYRIIHIKKEQHIMKGPVNFLKEENTFCNTVNILLSSPVPKPKPPKPSPNPVKPSQISSKGTGADTKILKKNHEPNHSPNY